MRVFNIFLFRFTLPMSVILGLGIKTDIYDPDVWRFVGAFLMMRAIMLLACVVVVGGLQRGTLGDVTVNWLSTTWISTVILGVPLLKALLGPQYSSLGVVAGISSFIFQLPLMLILFELPLMLILFELPLMLILFEVHVWRQEVLHGTLPETQPNPATNGGSAPLLTDGFGEHGKESRPDSPDGKVVSSADVHPEPAAARSQRAVLSAADASALPPPDKTARSKSSLRRMGDNLIGCLHFRMTKSQGKRLGLRLVMNHVLWGVGIGLILSLSKIGPKWLDPGPSPPCKVNCSYAVGAGFLYILCDYFARCTEPVAFFATGMWMVRPKPIACGYIKAAIYMLIKLVLVPALMVGCCFTVGLEGAIARAAVLVATLPVSAAAFALSKTYNVGEDIAVANVFLGNLLVLPTTIIWLEFMDGVNLFPAPPAKVPSTC
ncbi:PIN isoform B [Chlorella sorokiniana]|uniref:PIN isoform B n=1 Tax=Chlorella sorokiniana TaxID=3076 RepID=A0A2P6U015_CHLSO|nr:PIN isoform B [Chlorella sorokiniana]|eukprot:PRW59648.1 PIN isoform B [Chlorella sorokiniana]